MKRKLWCKMVYALTCFIQASLIGAVFIINDLTGKKAGVMHHVYYKRNQYEQGIYSLENLGWQKLLAVILGILFLLFLIYAVKEKKNRFYKIQLFIASVISFLVYFVICSNFFISMLAYPYFIMVLEWVLLIQIIIIIGIHFCIYLQGI